MATAEQVRIDSLNEYQETTRETAQYPTVGEQRFLYPVLGLAGEVGELTNKVKKIFRDDKNQVTDERREAMIGELGDILWYTARIADELDVKLSDIASGNIEKLRDRRTRGTLPGSGDNR